jgi:hypothetical protein
MTNPTWPIGPAKVKDPKAVAHILGYTDIGEPCGYVAFDDVRVPAIWFESGKMKGFNEIFDLLPPKLTRDEAINECISAYIKGWNDGGNNVSAVRECLEHWEKLKTEARIDE